MKKDLIKALKLLKYSPRILTYFWTFSAIVIFECINGVGKYTWLLFDILLMTVSNYIIPILMELNYSGLFQSSAYHKKSQISLPVILTAPISLVIYTLLIVFRGFSMLKVGEADNFYCYIITLGIASCLMYLWLLLIYKYFVLAIIAIYGIYMPYGLYFLRHVWKDMAFYRFITANLLRSVVIGYAFLILGFVLFIVLSSRLYKKGLSRYGMGIASKNMRWT